MWSLLTGKVCTSFYDQMCEGALVWLSLSEETIWCFRMLENLYLQKSTGIRHMTHLKCFI